MFGRSTILSGFLASAFGVCVAGRAVAELLTALLPDGVPGYDADDSVTVETRLHPDQMPLGVREGVFRFLPQLDESFGYNSNVFPGPHRRGSWQIVTAPAVAIDSDWSRGGFGASASAQDTRDVSLPSQDRTDATVSAGGRIDVGNGELTVAAAHTSRHEDRSAIDSIASDRPIAFTLDDVRASYAVSDGRWRVTPEVEASNWTYSNTTILGTPASQAYRDRMVTQGGVTVQYELAPRRSVVFVARVIGQDYLHMPADRVSLNSTGYQLLAGVDFNDDPIWRWRLLVGAEIRQFASRQYPQQDTVIAKVGIGWSPSEVTSVSATVSRDTEDAAEEGVSGLVYTSARLTIDHEALRNLVLKASAGIQRADYFQGGHQTGTTEELGVTWVLDRNAKVSFTYDQTDLHGSATAVPGQALVAGYSRGLGLVTMHLAL
jgi:hypothetical protein